MAKKTCAKASGLRAKTLRHCVEICALLLVPVLIFSTLSSCKQEEKVPEESITGPFEYTYAPFDLSDEEKVFDVSGYEGEPFSGEIIQKAIDDCAPGCIVYIPEGTYRITSRVNIKSDITLAGDN